VYVNRHGEPRPTNPVVEWEGTAEHITLHHPYIVIFSQRFIEIRDKVTGQVLQIIRGHQVRGIPTNPAIVDETTEGGSAPQPGIYATLVEEEDSLDAKVLVRKLVELVPVKAADK